MIKYEKSYEKQKNNIEVETLVQSEYDCEMVITDISERRLKWILEFMEKLADIWSGTIKISYEENDEIRDYVICVTTDVMDFYNSRLAHDFSDLLTDADFLMVRSYPKDRNKVEIIVIQSNAEEIYPENEI